jgi:hypothetical protein
VEVQQLLLGCGANLVALKDGGGLIERQVGPLPKHIVHTKKKSPVTLNRRPRRVQTACLDISARASTDNASMSARDSDIVVGILAMWECA